ncbi:RNA polymerase sigma factor [Sphingobacterium faecale]|uniref:Sigma-70 family RNA polymerase sigma factor n=1 Tax=Sphingobacterium faecale TaxID=2803775 RepID=A0ABS1R0N9_9SPHI|nr:sigma-70 family RNA polymerase sigma factor [Sphingobacterium faecale]MBL1408268.1 sigma-70 family RNA polymerase sigma factor [Sphingobacterium faecale]
MQIRDNYLLDFKEGKESSLQHYINVHGKALRFFAFTIVRNKEVAEEIVSDSFFKLWKGRDRVKKEINIKAFLYLVTRNACFDYLDLSKLSIEHDFDLGNLERAGDDDILTKMIRIELIQLIIDEVNKLPEQQAAIFKMTYLDGFTADEISRKLNTTVSNVYFARSKALSSLKMNFSNKGLLSLLALVALIEQHGCL